MQTRVERLARAALRRPKPLVPGDAGEIAFLGPLPPAPTGIATYDRAVLDGLQRIGFAERQRLEVLWPVEPKHGPRMPGYRLGIFQLGNNVEFHQEIYRLAFMAPALVVLHDLALDDFVRGLLAAGDPLGFVAAREAGAARYAIEDADVLRNEPLREPWCAHVARRARGIIVHSDFGRRYLESFGCRTPVFVVPHPPVEEPSAFERARPTAAELRSSLEARGMRTLVVAPGDLNAAKQLEAALAAVGRLGDDVHLALVGRRIEGYDADAAVKASGLGARATLHADVTDEEFRSWLVASDIVVDLRYPHRGEVSGSLMRAMQAGRPTVVSATGSYLDVSDDAVVRVKPGPADAAELSGRIDELAQDPARRARMGEAARARMGHLRSSEATARGYADAALATLDLVGDPARDALGRWARSLADIGVDEDMLRAGHGLAYARALATFTGSQSETPGRD